GQHRQRVAQVDHLVQAQPEKILGGRTVSHLELPENSAKRRKRAGNYTPKSRKCQDKSDGYEYFRVDDVKWRN
ncbi:hypothetical protein, partial [Tepidimonas taiwanensis]|uniref:hypothetical protein n=1 Tax=Tepidimonas taiwanensis TaxID=307486 RepID=UPI00137A4033